jgi:hypothetical protein
MESEVDFDIDTSTSGALVNAQVEELAGDNALTVSETTS